MVHGEAGAVWVSAARCEQSSQWNQAQLHDPLRKPDRVSELKKDRTSGSQFIPALYPFQLVSFWCFPVEEIYSLGVKIMYISGVYPPLAPFVLFPGGKVIMLVKYITKYFHRNRVGFYITLIFLVKDWLGD